MMPTMLDLAVWAQQPGFGPGPGRPGGGSAAPAIFAALCFLAFALVVSIFFIAVMWKIFTKAGEPGWACLVPVYSLLVLARICGRQEIFGLVYAIPCVGMIIMCLDLAKAFDKETGFAVGLMLVGIVFFPMLAFGDAQHVGSRRRRLRRRPRRYEEEDEEDDRPRRRRMVDDDDEEDDRPRRRPVEDEEEDEPPRRRPAARDEGIKRRPPEDDRVRRKRPADEDEDDDPRPRRRPQA